MAYHRPSFKLDRTIRSATRSSGCASNLNYHTGGGQLFLLPSDVKSQFEPKERPHASSKLLESILKQHDRRSKPTYKKNWNGGTSLVIMTSPNTLSRPDIASRRKKRNQTAQHLASKKWKKRALWRARRLGFTNPEAEEEIKTFSDYCNKKNNNDNNNDNNNKDTTRKLRFCQTFNNAHRKWEGNHTSFSAAEAEAEKIALESQTQMNLTQLMCALGELFYPNLMPTKTNNNESGNESDNSTFSDPDPVQDRKLLQDIAMWLLHRHTETGYIDVVQWMTMITSGDIDIAMDVVQQNRTKIYTSGRKRGLYRPTKGHIRPASAFVKSPVRTFESHPKLVKVRQTKSNQMSNKEKKRVIEYINHRGIRLGMQRCDIEKAKKDALTKVEESLNLTSKTQRSSSNQIEDENDNDNEFDIAIGSNININIITELDTNTKDFQFQLKPPPVRAASASTNRSRNNNGGISPQSRHRRLVKSRPSTSTRQRSRPESRGSSKRSGRSRRTTPKKTKTKTQKKQREEDDLDVHEHPELNFYSSDHFMDLTESCSKEKCL